MNLLPKSTADFGSTEYWNSFFRKRGKQAFEWYGEYPELCGQLHKYIKPKDEILVVGCGNSKLSVDLYDVGFKKITNIDISPVVIKQMQEANRSQRPEMTWCQMDATAMTLPDESFSVVLDKGTLDALFTDQSEEVVSTVRRYFKEIGRVLRSGGRYVCISLLQEHILREVVEHFPSHHFMLRIVRCPDAGGRDTSEAANADGSSLVVFAIVATKFKNLPMRVLEICMAGDQMERVQQPEELIGAVAAAQKAAMVCNGLARGSIAGMAEVSIDLFHPNEKQTPRYTIHVLDQAPKRGSGKYAAFIVPQGRETEWLFATTQGRQKLQVSANFDRLAVVTLHRGHVYTDLEAVKVELAESVKSLAPSGLQGASIPYLSIGAEVGRRETIHTGRSEHSGEYLVEEIVGDNGRTFRRLIFLANQSVVQSEAALKMARVRGSRAPQKVVDPGYLACQHHLFMTVGVQLATRLTMAQKTANETKTTSPPSSSTAVAVIGLGGGGLCTFIRECLKSSTITAVEIDPEIERIAVKYFGLTLDNRLRVVIEDGIRFLAEEATRGAHYSAVLFDVDSKDPTVGMSCPPAIFVERNVLAHVRQLVGDEGLFVLNLVCRNDALRETTVQSLRESFKYVLSYKLEEDVNEVFYCTDNERLKDATNWQQELRESANDVNKLARKEKLTHEQELVDLSDFVNALQI
ncbi:eEF1A lysine and N-terminal methyltransferase homolog [Anopheles ziemanni]|uniref:eEF1A lysine and N-terminal methyltransferase homolog n=1 Tax=Anopheles coustani TaxID=139045 RepID=UPI00265AF1F9|nr:eEF1A lysine and N-terminal methyltransferase homolog [Anopheles coustani]XP_058172255.1 eEF1A lysine and N-terminal methyltransferase homolog [Anopheles ziemanni]